MIEASGRELLNGEEERDIDLVIEGESNVDTIHYLNDKFDDPDSFKPQVKQIFNEADKLLQKEFGFYSFGIRANYDQQIDIANRCLIRYYKK